MTSSSDAGQQQQAELSVNPGIMKTTDPLKTILYPYSHSGFHFQYNTFRIRPSKTLMHSRLSILYAFSTYNIFNLKWFI